MRRVFTILFVLGLILASAPALAQGGANERADDARDNRGEDARREDARESTESDRQDRAKPSDERSKTARDARPIGAFRTGDGERHVTGYHVQFDQSERGITNFTANGPVLFDALVTGGEPSRQSSEVRANGGQILVRHPNYDARVHDNPGAVTKIHTSGVIELRFASDANVTLVNGHGARFRVGEQSGTVRGDDLRLENGVLFAAEEALIVVSAPRGGHDVHRNDIDAAITKRAVGAELTVAADNGAHAEDSVSYGNVTLTTEKAEKGNLTVIIDGHGLDGRVVVVNVDGRVIGASAADKLDIKFDNVSIARADSITDVLDPDDDGLQPEYYLVHDPLTDTFQVIVSVPHYSIHTLSVGVVVLPTPPAIIVGLLAGVLLLVPGGYALFRRRD